MDHLDRSKAAAFPQPRIPYVCLQPYNGESFMSYPSSQGYDLQKARECDFERDWQSHVAEAQLPLANTKLVLESFLQSWLFFGLLCELHTAVGLTFDQESFISEDTSVTVVCSGQKIGKIKRLNTEPLHDLFVTWYDLSQELEHEDVEQLCRPINGSLSILYQISYRLTTKSQNYVDDDLLLSFMSLGQSTEHALQWIAQTSLLGRQVPRGRSTVVQQRQNDATPWLPEPRGWDAPNRLFTKLICNGWCPNEVETLRKNFQVNEVVYASQLRRVGDRGKHRVCTPALCGAANIDDATYRTQHHPGFCERDTCTEVRIDYARICEIIEADSTPLIQARADDATISFRVAPDTIEQGEAAGAKVPYVAVSHVWAHGLGNNKRNALPSCQMKALYRYTSSIPDFWDGKNISVFWIDTLCVPVQHDHLRKRAIAGMSRVYREAKHVLVLDEALMRTSLLRNDNDSLDGDMVKPGQMVVSHGQLIHQKELTFVIMFSDWWRRLWTLQEGLLNTSVHLLIGEGIICLQDVVMASGEDHVSNRADMSSDALKWCLHNLIDRKWEFNHISHRRKVLSLLFNRTTSHASDEPACLATLMGLDVAKILEAPRETRMEQFYMELNKVPAALLFVPGARLQKPGFRWAPSTFLGSQGPGSRFVFTLLQDRYDYEAKATAEGLEVESPSFQLSLMGAAPTCGFYIMPGEPGTLPEPSSVDSPEPDYTVTSVTHQDTSYDKRLWHGLEAKNMSDIVVLIPKGRDINYHQTPAVLAAHPTPCSPESTMWTAKYVCSVHLFTNTFDMYNSAGTGSVRARVEQEMNSLNAGKGYTGGVAWVRNDRPRISKWLIT